MSDVLPDHPKLPPAGWYHDGTTMRWWDGSSWGPVAPPGSFQAPGRDSISSGSTLAVLCHVAFFFFAVVFALVVRLTEGKKDDYTRHHSTEALNFQLTFLIAWMVSFFVVFASMFAATTESGDEASAWILLPFVALFGLYAVGLVFSIVGAVRARRGEWWRYPVSIRFVRGARPRR